MAFARVKGAISGDAGDLLIRRDLVEQFGQHGCIAHIAGGELGGSDFQRLLVNSDVELALDATLRATMFAGIPLPFALNLDSGAVDQQVQGTLRAAKGYVSLQGLLAAAEGAEVRHSPVQVDQVQQAFNEASSV